MKRHAYMLDLLRPSIELDAEVEHLHRKGELTVEDLEEIMTNARIVERAAGIVRAHKLGLRRT